MRACKHGDASKRGEYHRLYRIWGAMISRCTKTRCNEYPHYGGRGIFICREWFDYQTFKDWALKAGYADGLEIDRIDNDGNYSPENCRFTTHAVNMGNRRVSHLLTLCGRTECLAAWDLILGRSKGYTRYHISALGESAAIKKFEIQYSRLLHNDSATGEVE
jgi:hypothetical protein